MLSRSAFLGLSFLTLGLSGGCYMPPKPPPKTQLQIREIQTRSYPTNNTKMVLKAIVNVLQDDGYIIRNAEAELGVVNATRDNDVENSSDAFAAQIFNGANASWSKSTTIECSANVSEFGKETRVRLNFQRKTLDNFGRIVTVETVDDLAFYRDFFSRVDKGIFLEREKI